MSDASASVNGELIGTYRGYNCFVSHGVSYSCPALKLFGFRDDYDLKKGIDRKLGPGGTPNKDFKGFQKESVQRCVEALLGEAQTVPQWELADIQKATRPALMVLRMLTLEKLDRMESGSDGRAWSGETYAVEHGQAEAKLAAIDARIKELK